MKGTPCAPLVGMQIDTSAIENSMNVPQKLKTDLPCNLAILLLGIFPNKNRNISWKDICIPVFIIALFMKAKYSSNTHPLMDNWQEYMVSIYLVDYYSAIKTSEILHLQQHGMT